MNLGRLDEARAHLEQAAELRPWSAPARSNLAAVLIRLEQYDLAAEQCRVALDRDPDSFEANYNMADAQAGLGHWEQAAEHYQRVIRMRPGFVRAYVGLGHSLLSLGRVDEAIDVYRDGLRTNPSNAALTEGLRRAIERRNKREPVTRRDQNSSPPFVRVGTSGSSPSFTTRCWARTSTPVIFQCPPRCATVWHARYSLVRECRCPQ